jgi:hypothetical protein
MVGFFIARGVSSCDLHETLQGFWVEYGGLKRTIPIVLFSIEESYTLAKSVRSSSTGVWQKLKSWLF